MSYHPGRRAMTQKFATVGLLFLAVFNGLSFAAEQIHALESLGDAFERRFDLGPEAFDRVMQGLTALVTLTICLRINRALELHRLTRSAHWRKPESQRTKDAGALEAKANHVARNLNLRTLLAFAISLPIGDALLQVATIEHSIMTAIKWSGPIASFLMRVWPSVALTVLAWGCMLLSQKLWLARLQNIDLPGDEEEGLGALLDDERDLRFRLVTDDPADATHTEAHRDIEQLAKTETYGVMGETDIPQVFDWWRKYPRGNWLAEFRGRIVGGVDIWPLKKAVYERLRAGRIGEEHIKRTSIAPKPDSDTGSYWYVASISLDLRLRHQRLRKAVLAKLVETMLEQNFLPSVSAYPAHVIALIWTTQGENIANRSGFRYVNKRVSEEHAAAEPIYEIVFPDEASIRAMIERIRRRLAPPDPSKRQPPVEKPG
jgi:hypothetical protein